MFECQIKQTSDLDNNKIPLKMSFLTTLRPRLLNKFASSSIFNVRHYSQRTRRSFLPATSSFTSSRNTSLFPSQWHLYRTSTRTRIPTTVSSYRALSTAKRPNAESAEEASSIIQQSVDGNHPNDNLPMTTGQKVAEGGKASMIIGAFGVAAACAGLLAWELRPTKFSPQSIFDKALSAVREHPDVTMRIGNVEKGYGTDHGGKSEGRRNFTAHDEFEDEEGHKIVRIKFNVKGTRGQGTVFAAVSSGVSGDMLQYLIFQHQPSRGKPISYSLVDNRRVLTTEDKQMRLSQNIAKIGGVMYGSEDDPYTQRQKMEFGDYFDKIKYVDCSKEHGLEKQTQEYCEKLKGKFPTWKFGENVYPGLRTKEVMDKICKFEVQHAAQQAEAKK